MFRSNAFSDLCEAYLPNQSKLIHHTWGGTIWMDLRNSFLWLGPFLQLIHALEVLTFMTAYSILHLLRNMAIDLWLSVVVYLLLCGFERGYRVLIIRRNNTDFMVSYLWTYRLVSTPRVGTVLRIGRRYLRWDGTSSSSQ